MKHHDLNTAILSGHPPAIIESGKLHRLLSLAILPGFLLTSTSMSRGQGFPNVTQTQYAKIAEVHPNGDPNDTVSSPNPRTVGLDYAKGYLILDTRGIRTGSDGASIQVWNVANPANPTEIVSARRGIQNPMHTYSTLLPNHRASSAGDQSNNLQNPLNIVRQTPSGYTPKDNGSRGLTVFPYQYSGGTSVQIYDARTSTVVSTINHGFEGTSTPIGNLLIIAGIRDQARGFATYDISDPADPILLDLIAPSDPVWRDSNPAYEYAIWKHFLVLPNAFGSGATRDDCAFVSFADPKNLLHVLHMPASSAAAPTSTGLPGRPRYAQFQDNKMFLGSGIYDMSPLLLASPAPPTLLQTLPHDGEYMLPLGNLMVSAANMEQGLIDDFPNETSPFKMRIFAHQSAPDTTKPTVSYHNPVANAVNQHVKSRIGVVIHETVDYETITSSTFRVYPVSATGTASTGSDVAGTLNWHDKDILTFTPNVPLAYDQRYRVHLGAIKDVAGNAMNSFSFYFTTESLSRPRISPITLVNNSTYPGRRNTQINFSASTGGGTGTLSYSWTFGDGTADTPFSSSDSTKSHSYTAVGHYTVKLRVRDSSSPPQERAATIGVTVADPVSTQVATKGSQMVLDSSRARVWVVNPDQNTVTSFRTNSTRYPGTVTKADELTVGADPRSIAQDSAGNLWVTCHDADKLEVYSTAGEPAEPTVAQGQVGARTITPLRTLTFPHGSRPHDVVFNAAKTFAYVTLTGSGKVVRINPANTTLTVDAEVLADATPAAIAVNANNNSLLVTRFISPDAGGEIRRFNNASGAISPTPQVISLSPDTTSVENGSAGRGLPNYLADVAIDPMNTFAYVSAKKDNIYRGHQRDGLALTHDSTVRAMISKIDLATNTEVLGSRLDIDDASQPSAMIFSPHGDYLFVAIQGNNEVKVIDTFTGQVRTTLPTVSAPQGLCFDPVTNKLFINSLTGTAIGVYNLDAALKKGEFPFAQTAVVTKTTSVILNGQQTRGKQIFYNAGDERMSLEGYLACATCHQDGGHDGRVWDFTDRGEGLRNTTDLRGRSTNIHGNVHWTGNFNEIEDFENDIRTHFGGTGFIDSGVPHPPLGTSNAGRSTQLTDLREYVRTLNAASVPKSPQRNSDGKNTTEAILGKQLFYGRYRNSSLSTATLTCTTCHSGQDTMNSTLTTELKSNTVTLNIGTILQPQSGKAAGLQLNSIDTPTLMGLHAGAPYLHHGLAQTLEDVFKAPYFVSGSALGQPGSAHNLTPTGYNLSADEMTQLMAFLRQIDGRLSGSVVAPAAPSSFSATLTGNNVSLTWNANTESDLASYTLFRSTHPGRLGSALVTGLTTNSFLDTSAQNGVTYYYTVRAVDTLENISTSSSTQVITRSLPSPWKTIDIGESAVGSASVANGVYTVAGSGVFPDNGTSEKFRYVYQTLSGDGSMIVRIKSRNGTAVGGALAGIMIRETTSVDSKYGMIALRNAGTATVRFLRRANTGGASSRTSYNSLTVPDCWFKIERVGDSIRVSRSSGLTTPITWSNPVSQDIPMGTNVNVGFVVCSNSDSIVDSAEFDNVIVDP